MPQVISEEVAGAAINNAIDQDYDNVFSGWMYATNCAETVLQWRIFASPSPNIGDIDVYTFVAGTWMLESFPYNDSIGRCQAGVDAIGYLQGSVELPEYRLLRVTGSAVKEQTEVSTGGTNGFPHTWEAGMTAYLTPATDIADSILESSVVWNLDSDGTTGFCTQTTWPTPTT